MRLIKLLANLGYGSRKDVQFFFKQGLVCDQNGNRLTPDAKIAHEDIRFNGKKLDPDFGVVLMLYKPCGYVCSTKDRGHLVYELLPPRFSLRKPVLSSIGRLDADTSGLLLFTDDGDFLHRIISPKTHVEKVYEVNLARPLNGDEGEIFASGTLMLDSEKTPLKPALLQVTGDKSATLTLTEGRYHQVRRMFAATGNHVETLHRQSIGALTLDGLNSGQWRLLSKDECLALPASKTTL